MAQDFFGREARSWIAPPVPEQMRGQGRSTPEQRLMAAVLEDALRELARPGGDWLRARARRRAEVQGWFASDDVVWPFSFVNVCEALDLDPRNVRSCVERPDPCARRAVRS